MLLAPPLTEASTPSIATASVSPSSAENALWPLLAPSPLPPLPIMPPPPLLLLPNLTPPGRLKRTCAQRVSFEPRREDKRAVCCRRVDIRNHDTNKQRALGRRAEACAAWQMKTVFFFSFHPSGTFVRSFCCERVRTRDHVYWSCFHVLLWDIKVQDTKKDGAVSTFSFKPACLVHARLAFVTVIYCDTEHTHLANDSSRLADGRRALPRALQRHAGRRRWDHARHRGGRDKGHARRRRKRHKGQRESGSANHFEERSKQVFKGLGGCRGKCFLTVPSLDVQNWSPGAWQMQEEHTHTRRVPQVKAFVCFTDRSSPHFY